MGRPKSWEVESAGLEIGSTFSAIFAVETMDRFVKGRGRSSRPERYETVTTGMSLSAYPASARCVIETCMCCCRNAMMMKELVIPLLTDWLAPSQGLDMLLVTDWLVPSL